MDNAVLYLGILTEDDHDNMGQHANPPPDDLLRGLHVPCYNPVTSSRNLKIRFHGHHEDLLNA